MEYRKNDERPFNWFETQIQEELNISKEAADILAFRARRWSTDGFETEEEWESFCPERAWSILEEKGEETILEEGTFPR